MGKWIRSISRLSFKRKLFLYSILLSIVPVFILGMVSSYMTAKSIQEEVDHNHTIILQQLELQIDSFMRSLDQVTLELANDQYIKKSMDTGIASDQLQLTLYTMDTIQRMIRFSEVDFHVSLYYEIYNQIYSSQYGVVRELNQPFTDLVSTIRERINGVTVSPVHTNAGLPEIIMVRSIPLNSLNPDGYVILHLDLNNLKRFIDQLDLGENRRVVIIDDQGKVVMSQNVDEVGNEWTYTNLTETIELADTEYSIASIQSSINDWTYFAMTPADELTAKANSIQLLTLGIMVIIALLWFVLALIGTRRLYVPIQKLVAKFPTDPKQHQDELQSIDKLMSRMQQSNEHLQTQLQEQQPHLKENMVHQLLRGEISNKSIRKFTKDYGLDLLGEWFCVCVVDIDQYGAFLQMYKNRDRSLMMYALRNMIEELSEPLDSYVSVIPKPGQVVLVIGFQNPTPEAVQSVVQVSEHIRDNVRKYFTFTVSVVISNARQEYSRIHESYEEALNLLEFRWMKGLNQSITPHDVEPALNQSSRLMVQWKTEVLHSILQGSFTQAREQLSEMVEAAPRVLHNSEAILALFANLIGEIDNFLNELGYELNDLFEYDILSYLFELSSLEEVRHWISGTVFTTIEQHLQAQQLSNRKKIISQVMIYIHEHYETDLSLQRIADHFDLSPSMLSKMFKEETGENYIDYLIRFRIDKAKEWLIHTEMPIKEMTDRLRYTSVQNFTRIFKQVTGMPPGAFRKMHREGLKHPG